MLSPALEKLKRFTRACEGEGVAFAIKFVLHRAAPRLFSSPPPALEPVFNHLNKAKSFTLIQIGAYIGETSNDPLVRFLKATLSGNGRPDAKVVLVEPVREYFEKLKENYRDLPGVRFENVAIAEQEGARDFYRIVVDPTRFGLPEYLAQLGSLRSDRMTKLWDSYENDPTLQKFYLEHRVVEKVQCITFKQLLQKHQISEVDFLQIDTEGYDFEILKSIDFSTTRPRFVNYERVLLQGSEEECRKMMRKSGYRLRDWGQDTLYTRTARLRPRHSSLHVTSDLGR
jgi:FkbM family methyltransferase